MSVKLRTNFARDGHRTAVIGTDPIVKLMKITDKVALLRHFSEFYGNINELPIHEGYIIIFVEQPNSLSLDLCENKWYQKLNA